MHNNTAQRAIYAYTVKEIETKIEYKESRRAAENRRGSEGERKSIWEGKARGIPCTHTNILYNICIQYAFTMPRARANRLYSHDLIFLRSRRRALWIREHNVIDIHHRQKRGVNQRAIGERREIAARMRLSDT